MVRESSRVLLLLAFGCTPAPQSTPGAPRSESALATGTSSVTIQTASPGPSGTIAEAGPDEHDPSRQDAGAYSKLLRITMTMATEGSIDHKALAIELDRQLLPLEPCVALIRRTDQVVGSLNLQVKVDSTGQISVDLQSPVNPEAKRCLLAGMRSWHVVGTGAGTSMVLLELTDKTSRH